VLVVEDEVLLRLELADALRSASFRVLEAKNADDAVALLEADHAIAVVCTDIQMPGSMNGIDLAKWVRANFPVVKIVVLSGSSAGLPEGLADAVIKKPMMFSSVVARIRGVLEAP
jgi:DNA-binding response OmpR family regulator